MRPRSCSVGGEGVGAQAALHGHPVLAQLEGAAAALGQLLQPAARGLLVLVAGEQDGVLWFAGQLPGVVGRGSPGQHARTGDDDQRLFRPGQLIALPGVLDRADELAKETARTFLKGRGEGLGELLVNAADGPDHAIGPDGHLGQVALLAERFQREQDLLCPAQGKGRDEHLTPGGDDPGHRVHQAALLGGAVGVQPAAVGALQYEQVRPDARRDQPGHRALGRDRDVATDQDTALVAFQKDHRCPGDVAGRVKGGGQAVGYQDAGVKGRRHQGLQQLFHGEVVEQGQVAFLLHAAFHDFPGVLVQHADESNCCRGGVHGAVVWPCDQLQAAAVVEVGVGHEYGVDSAGPVDLAEVG
jgi:hypothetical protein